MKAWAGTDGWGREVGLDGCAANRGVWAHCSYAGMCSRVHTHTHQHTRRLTLPGTARRFGGQSFYTCDRLTLCPIQKRMIAKELLSQASRHVLVLPFLPAPAPHHHHHHHPPPHTH